MVRSYLQCDLCGDKWDISNTEYYDKINPGLCYANDKIREGVRSFVILRAYALTDNQVAKHDMDICDKCYNKLDRFIYELANGEEKEDD